LIIPVALRDAPAAYRAWLLESIARIEPSRLILDTFPAGLFHELAGTSLPCPVDYVARYLRWDRYEPRDLPAFATTYVLEPLHEEQERWIVAHSKAIDRAPRLADPPGVDVLPLLPPHYALVVHSGNAEEVAELIDYAVAAGRAARAEEPIVVVTQSIIPRDDVIVVDTYPAIMLAAGATRIITAAGFNCMRQFRGDPRHHAIPFERRFDDQFARVMRAEGPARAGQELGRG
jgi:predicted glycosyltransferase